MKDSEGGVPSTGNEWLLNAESASDVCLSCHAEQFGAVLGSDPMNPPPERGAGNFAFLFEDNLNDAPDGATNILGGHAAGHNINAPGHGLYADPSWSIAPGGTFLSSKLSCTSCHDPHGNANFRMLNGAGEIQAGEYSFIFDAPDAVGIDFLTGVESATNHTAYRSGFSQWCSNCHGEYHDVTGFGGFQHRFNHPLSARFATEYNRYNGTADPIGGTFASAYLPEVPFEEPGMEPSSSQGPFPSSRTMCLTCHRAHASSAPRATRWDTRVDMLGNDGAVSGSYPIANPYTDPNQTTLCRKCHSAYPIPGPPSAPDSPPID